MKKIETARISALLAVVATAAWAAAPAFAQAVNDPASSLVVNYNTVGAA